MTRYTTPDDPELVAKARELLKREIGSRFPFVTSVQGGHVLTRDENEWASRDWPHVTLQDVLAETHENLVQEMFNDEDPEEDQEAVWQVIGDDERSWDSALDRLARPSVRTGHLVLNWLTAAGSSTMSLKAVDIDDSFGFVMETSDDWDEVSIFSGFVTETCRTARQLAMVYALYEMEGGVPDMIVNYDPATLSRQAVMYTMKAWCDKYNYWNSALELTTTAITKTRNPDEPKTLVEALQRAQNAIEERGSTREEARGDGFTPDEKDRIIEAYMNVVYHERG